MSLMCYSKNDKVLKKIANRGGGPGEYSSVSSIVANERNNTIYALIPFTSSGPSIYKYDFDGNFLGNIDLEERADAIGITEEGLLVAHIVNWSGFAKNQYIVMDDDGNIITKYANPFQYQLSAERQVFQSETASYTYKNEFHIKDKSDTLYVFRGDKRYPKYVFRNSSSIDNKSSLSQTEYDNAIVFWYIFETDSRLQFAFLNQRSVYHYAYDKNTNQLYFSDVRDIPNDLMSHQFSSRFKPQFNDFVFRFSWDGAFEDEIEEETLFVVLFNLKQ